MKKILCAWSKITDDVSTSYSVQVNKRYQVYPNHDNDQASDPIYENIRKAQKEALEATVPLKENIENGFLGRMRT